MTAYLEPQIISVYGATCNIYPRNNEYKADKDSDAVILKPLKEYLLKQKSLRFVIRKTMGPQGMPELIWGLQGRPGDEIYAHVELVNPQLRYAGDWESAPFDTHECLAAGEMFFNKQGEICGINNLSGGYRPDIGCLKIALLEVFREGIPIAADCKLEQADIRGNLTPLGTEEQNLYFKEAKQLAALSLIQDSEPSKLNRLLKDYDRKANLEVAIAALDDFIKSLQEGSPKRKALEVYSQAIQKESPSIPNRELPEATELTYRLLFHAKQPTHLENNKGIANIARHSKPRFWLYTGLAVFGILLALAALPTIIVSCGATAPLVTAIGFFGYQIATTALTAAIGVSSVGLVGTITGAAALTLGCGLFSSNRAYKTAPNMPIISKYAKDLINSRPELETPSPV